MPPGKRAIMNISDIDEEITDLDWFGLDQQGAIGHFTTGGFGALPRSVALSKEDLERVSKYFNNLGLNSNAPTVSAIAREILATKDEKAGAAYLQDYLKAASKGLYSFNYQHIGRRPAPYFLVAIPEKPLNVNDVSPEIQQILKRTILPSVLFSADTTVSVDAAK
jgi:hypothetical protein